MGMNAGQYRVGDKFFSVKSHAIFEATLADEDVHYHFYDKVWDAFDRSKLGKYSLNDLYKERARQLRESYDYLVLYYSGGIDSRTILKTFINNNIKLDAVFVKWPVSAANKNIYPIVTDRSSINHLCEWDLVIKQDLDRLKNKYPEIKIEVADWLDGISAKSFGESKFDNLQQFTYMTSLLRNPCVSQIETTLVDKGHKVAAIHGIDKPLIRLLDNGDVYMHFSDIPFGANPVQPNNPNGLEYFYWTPTMPIIAFEQAYCTAKYIENNPQYQNLFLPTKNHPLFSKMTKEKLTERHDESLGIVNSVIYSDYDPNIYQSGKAVRDVGDYIGNSKDWYIETHPEILEHKKVWEYNWKDWIQQYDKRFITPDTAGFFNILVSKSYHVTKIKRDFSFDGY